MSSPWTRVLDSLSAQLDLQEAALLRGHRSPAALDIVPPSAPLTGSDRLRAIELFARCEALLDEAADRAAGAPRPGRSPYGRTP